jgi:prepilin signal peptidase PulO-like enzyme (type II secretory pathway)
MIIAALVVLGLCFGSFVNALVWRLYQQALPAKKRVAKLNELSISKGRSMCPHCKHTLAPLDLLPVVSWLMLGGRCRYCSKPIGLQYPAVEALTALVFVSSYLFWPFAFDTSGVFQLVCWLVAVIGLMALIVYDVRWMLLPDKVVFPLIALGVVKVLAVSLVFDGGIHNIIMAALSVAVAGGLFFVLYQLSRGTWIGGGDVKLGYALGLFIAKPELALLMLFVASVLGLVVALPGLASKKLSVTSRLPFGPMLIVATILVMLFGQNAVDAYLNMMTLMVY